MPMQSIHLLFVNPKDQFKVSMASWQLHAAAFVKVASSQWREVNRQLPTAILKQKASG
jgi:hypothetical protein